MSWTGVIVASLLAFATKSAGYLVPGRLIDRPAVGRIGLALPASLLAALGALDTVTSGTRFVLDARLPAMAVAGVAVWRRAPFIIVVVLAALTAALWRLAAGS